MFEHTKKGKYILTITEENEYMMASLEITKQEANRLMDKEFQSKRKHIKVNGFRKGKISRALFERMSGGNKIQIYGVVFTNYFNNELMEHVPTRMMHSKDYHIKSHADGKWVVECLLYLEPKIDVSDEKIDNVDFSKIEPMDVEEYVDNRMKNFSKLHPILHPKNGPAENEDMIQVEVICTIDGKEFKPLCEERTNIRLIREAVIPREMYDQLIGHMAKDEFTFSAQEPHPIYGHKLKGKTLIFAVKVFQVFTCEESTINNDLAITANFNNLEDWTNHLTDSAKRIAIAQLRQDKLVALLRHITDQVEIDLPGDWAQDKQDELKHSGNDLEIDQIKKMSKDIIIMRQIGERLEVEWDDVDKSIYMRNDREYSNKVLAHILKRIEDADSAAA
jgi:trigger factor